MPAVPLNEAQAKLPELIHGLTPGEQVTITEDDLLVAQLVSLSPPSAKELPKKLYKYRPVNEHTKNIFLEESLYLPGRRQFNDPFDCRIKLNTVCTRERFGEVIKSSMKTEFANLSPDRIREETDKLYGRKDTFLER